MTPGEASTSRPRLGAACLGATASSVSCGVGAAGDLVVLAAGGIAFAGALSDPVEAWLRCGPVSARHTVVDGHVVVRDGELATPGLEAMLVRHTKISKAWQGVLET